MDIWKKKHLVAGRWWLFLSFHISFQDKGWASALFVRQFDLDKEKGEPRQKQTSKYCQDVKDKYKDKDKDKHKAKEKGERRQKQRRQTSLTVLLNIARCQRQRQRQVQRQIQRQSSTSGRWSFQAGRHAVMSNKRQRQIQRQIQRHRCEWS